MFVIPKSLTALEILTAINIWGGQPRGPYVGITTREEADNLHEARRLWRILTALRGPDNGSDDLKMVTTALIRGAVVPDFAKAGGALTSDGPRSVLVDLLLPVAESGVEAAEQWIQQQVGYMPSIPEHFLLHFRHAAAALFA